MLLTMLVMLLCIDNGAIPFSLKCDAILGTKIIKRVFARIGLTIYTGAGNKISKTKAVFFPSTGTIK